MPERIPISKRVRFEIFKRDGFCCHYCGGHPPGVVLEIDHIIPVSKKGSNDLENLVTSCFSCNRGKSDVQLTTLPQKTFEKIELIKEKEDQYKEYKKLLLAIDRRIQKEAVIVNKTFQKYFPEETLLPRFIDSSLKQFINELGFPVVNESMNKACSKFPTSEKAAKYFCGICWRKIKGDYKYV